MARVAFGPYQLDLVNGELYRSGMLVRLQPQPAKLLVLLVARAGEVVTRETIRERVWGRETFVDFEQGVNFCMRQVRAALHDHASTPCYVETVPRRGYRFIAPVTLVPAAAETVDVATPAVSSSSRARRLLAAGVLASCTGLVGIAVATSGRWTFDAPRAANMCAQAHHEVHLGRFFLDKFSADGMTTAVRHFESALTLDPGCAPAYAGLAEAYNQQASVFLSIKRPSEVRRLAINAATRAIELDPTLAEAHAALGYATMHEMDWQRAGTALRRAIELNPRYVVAHEIHAAYLADQRRFREAIDEARLAVDLAPASQRARRTLGWMLYFARQYDEAIRELRTVVQMDPANAYAHFRLGAALLVTGRSREAVLELEQAVELGRRGPAALGLLGMAYGADGRRADALRMLEELGARAATGYVAPSALLLGYIGVGDMRRAVDMVVHGYEERDNYEINIVVDPLMDPLRGDPRFEEICRKVMLGSALDPSMLARSRSMVRR